ncbi:hypothetical protein M9H77_18857 [Catharanthus roseus]|uniref:Uncharacterized protein n=1 Tax=Catharanthus roseus TaxID=4058 RepID=A0ACC0B8L0_CATRO|nr:hypothetical protein M9H77_18857 [Catharanthus roseus]
MAPKESIASFYESKRARIERTSPDTTTPNMLPFPKRLSTAALRILDHYMLGKLHSQSVFSLDSLMIHIKSNTGCDTTKKRCNYAGFLSIRKTTQTSIRASFLHSDDKESEDHESYNPSHDDARPTRLVMGLVIFVSSERQNDERKRKWTKIEQK